VFSSWIINEFLKWIFQFFHPIMHEGVKTSLFVKWSIINILRFSRAYTFWLRGKRLVTSAWKRGKSYVWFSFLWKFIEEQWITLYCTGVFQTFAKCRRTRNSQKKKSYCCRISAAMCRRNRRCCFIVMPFLSRLCHYVSVTFVRL
jgi:hypothetical protein